MSQTQQMDFFLDPNDNFQKKVASSSRKHGAEVAHVKIGIENLNMGDEFENDGSTEESKFVDTSTTRPDDEIRQHRRRPMICKNTILLSCIILGR